MINWNIKPQNIDLDEIDLIASRAANVRRNTEENYFSPAANAIGEDLLSHGQNKAAVGVRMDNGKIMLLQGNGRAAWLTKFRDEGRTYGLNAGEFSGKVPATIRMLVMKNLTAEEMILIRNDHGMERQLDEVEFFNTYIQRREAGMNEREIIIASVGMLDALKRPNRKVDVRTKDGYDYYRGRVQPYQYAYEGATVVREAFIKRQDKKQDWPINKQLREVWRTFLDEQKKDLTCRINQDNPGPEFQARWDEIVQAGEEAEAEDKPMRKTGMMGRKDIEKMAETCMSRTLKIDAQFKTGVRKIDGYLIFDTIVYRFEKGELSVAEFQAELDSISGVPDATTNVQTKTDVATPMEEEVAA